MTDNVVEARGLVKRFGDLTAVDHVDFEVHRGEFFGMLGPNGAGKSTTMRMVYRVTSLTSGHLTVLGLEAGRDDRRIKAQLGVVPQMDNLDEELPVLENLLLYARFHDIPLAQARQRAGQLLEFMELSGKSGARVRELSGGMKRRLTLARGLINEPRLLVLDEPTTGLDPQVRISLWDKLSELRTRGVTLLMTTHYMDEAERLCDRLLIIDHGKVIAQGSPRELIRDSVSPEVIEARLEPGGPGLERLQQEADRLGVVLHHAVDRVSLSVTDGRDVLHRLEERNLFLNGAYVRPGNLEDVFLKLTGRSLRQ
ncbi:MAG: ATP-binding cassette domain-containing protein [Candidatus Eremiobacterota bacterium]